MTKQEQGARREELLERIVDYLLLHGVYNLSLRPLAKAIGTSARLLVYHFGSKELLLVEALNRLREQIQNEFSKIGDPSVARSAEDIFLMFWHWAQLKRSRDHLKLFFEVYGLALHDPATYSRYLLGTTKTWLTFLDERFRRFKNNSNFSSAALNTFIVASMSGLLQDLLATGDLERTTNALRLLIDTISSLVTAENEISSTA